MKNKLESIKVYLFDMEVGIIAYDHEQGRTFFQYNAKFRDAKHDAFPFVIKNTDLTQSFSNVNNSTFKNLPAPFADSLPDAFGNLILNQWLETRNNAEPLTPIQQLAYMSNRGMGALEYRPGNVIPTLGTFGLNDVVSILDKVVEQKAGLKELKLNEAALYTILKIGTSAGGARPKIIVGQHKESGALIAGDRTVSKDYNHLLVKLNLPTENLNYNPCRVEHAYYEMAIASGIYMMPSWLIDNNHFATERFDRVDGEKVHTLTATGLTGWDFKDTTHSSYENLFKLSVALNVPHRDIEQTFRKMVFNVVNNNIDDHLKNHSFQYNPDKNRWFNTPSYDMTYALNPFFKYTAINRALSINGKRKDIGYQDIMAIAKKYSIYNANDIIQKVNDISRSWKSYGHRSGLDGTVINAIERSLKPIMMNVPKKSKGRKI